MKVTLLFVPNEQGETTKDWAFRDDGVGFIPPLSLLYVAGILEKASVEVQVIDLIAEGISYAQALERIKQFGPDLLGYTMNTYSFHPILNWVKRFKEDTGIPVLVGGAHVSLYPEETMSHPAIDYAIIGEAELPLPNFIQAFRDKTSFHGIKSLAFRDKGELYIDRTHQTIDCIDETPRPAIHLIRNEIYSNILTQRKNFTAMMSTRGCPFRCTFCDQKSPPYRYRSAADFVDEVKFNYHNYDIKEFDVYDSTFTANRKRVIEICDLLKAENMDIGWTIRSTLMAITHDLLDALSGAGCHTIMYGVETSNQDILKKMRKNIRPHVVWDRINYTKTVGIRALGFFMFGYPGETRESIEETIQLSLDLPLDFAQYTVLVPFPDTEIYTYYQQNSDLGDYWGDYTRDPSKEKVIELLDTGLTRVEASKYLGQAYRKFYFRPRIIWRRMLELRSSSQLMRLSRGAMGILKNSLKSAWKNMTKKNTASPMLEHEKRV